MFVGVWIYVRVFSLLPLIHKSVCMPIPNCFYCCTSIVELELRDCDVSISSFILQDCFSYPRFFVFHMKVNILLRSVKNSFWILMGITLNLQIAFGKIAIFTMSILHIQSMKYISNFRDLVAAYGRSRVHTAQGRLETADSTLS